MTKLSPTPTRDLVVRRIINAPLDAAWRAWSQAEQMQRWWGPSDYTCPLCKMDFREGGLTLVAMRSPDGVDHYTSIRYTRILPQERIEYITNLVDEKGELIAPESVGLPPDFPRDQRVQVTFRPLGQMTELVIKQFALPINTFYIYAALGLHQMADKITAATETE